MRDRDLYAQILGIRNPWRVSDVELTLAEGKVKVHVETEPGTQLVCPHCGRPVPGYDKRYKEWRHLDTCQYQTILAAEVPRVNCPEDGVSLIKVPWAEKGWKQWYSWAIRSRLEPIKQVARMIKQHLWGILNAVVLDANNGHTESINSKIKMIKVRSRGFRNKERFKTAIYFHLGGLDLYPEGVR